MIKVTLGGNDTKTTKKGVMNKWKQFSISFDNAYPDYETAFFYNLFHNTAFMLRGVQNTISNFHTELSIKMDINIMDTL